MAVTGGTSDPDAAEHSRHAVRALLSRGGVYSVASAIQGLTLFLLLPFATRLLSPSEYGMVAVALVLQTVLSVVAGAGMPEVLSRIYFLKPLGPQRARGGVALAVAVGAATAALVNATGPWWSMALLGLPYDPPLQLAVWSSVPLVAALASQAVLRASTRPGAYIATAAVANPGGHLLGLVLCAAWRPDATSYLIGNAVAVVVAGVIGLSSIGIVRNPTQMERADLALSLPAVPFALGLYVLWAGDRVIIAQLDSVAAVGRYQVAYLVGGFTLALVSAMYNAWLPVIYGADDHRRWDVLADTAALLYRLGGLVAGAIAVVAPFVIAVVAPPEYDRRELVVISAVIATATVPFVAAMAYLHVVLWHRRTRTLAWTTPTAAVVNIALNLLLVATVGLVGAAAATVVSYVLLALLLRFRARSLASVPPRTRALAEGSAATVTAGVLSVALLDHGYAIAPRVIAALVLILLAVCVVRRAARAPNQRLFDPPVSAGSFGRD